MTTINKPETRSRSARDTLARMTEAIVALAADMPIEDITSQHLVARSFTTAEISLYGGPAMVQARDKIRHQRARPRRTA